MPVSVARWLAAPKVYRIGIFGPAESGKTVILAALGLGAGRSSSGGSLCGRRKSLRGRRCPESAGWTADDLRKDSIKAFYRGVEWLNDAEGKLRHRQLPDQNSHNWPPLPIVYDLVIPDHGQVTFEVCDFAGELIGDMAQGSANSRMLDKVLQTVDALVVLAEATCPEAPAPALPEKLQLLEGRFLAFADARKTGVRLDVPVALVFNKWDRRGQAGTVPEDRKAEVERFLVESPVHERLVRTISNVTDRFEKFAASAFGAALSQPDDTGRPRPNTDRPATFPLPSFGLEEPFVWAVRQADARDFQKIIAEGTTLSWHSPNCGPTWRRARKAIHRFRPGSTEARQLATIVTRAGKRLAIQVAGIALMFSVMFFGVEWLVDARDHERAEAQLAAADSTDAQVDAALSWLDGYASSSAIRHRGMKLVFPSTEARRQLTEALRQREAANWDQVLLAKTDEQRTIAIDRYLERFPNGLHHEEARRLQIELIVARKSGENYRELEALRTDFQAAPRLADLLIPLLNRLDSLPSHRDTATTSWWAGRAILRKEIADALAECERDPIRKEWGHTKAEIDRQLEALQFGAAARNLFGVPHSLPDVIIARTAFPAQVLQMADDHASRAVVAQDWEPIHKLRTALNDPDVNSRLPPKDRTALQTILRRIQMAQDQHLYQAFSKAVDVESSRLLARRYVESAELKAMLPIVEKWLKWDKAMDQPANMQLVAEVHWKNWNGGKERDAVRIWIALDGEVILDETKSSSRDATTGKLGSKSKPVWPRKTVCVEFGLETTDTVIYGKKSNAHFKTDHELEARQLEDKSFELQTGDEKPTIHVTIEGLPVEPVRPAWKEPVR